MRTPPIQYATPAQPTPQRKVQTVEQTGKFWKGQIMLSALTAITGGVMIPMAQGDSDFRTIGILVLALGIVWFLVARIFAWWYHG